MSAKLLVVDVGGSKTDLGYCIQRRSGEWKMQTSQRVVSRDFSDLQSLIEKYLESLVASGARQQYETSPTMAVVAVAGPVDDGKAILTNLAWPEINAECLRTNLGFSRLRLVNDVEAMGYGIRKLEDSKILALNPGAQASDTPRIVIAPGTGLGQAFVVSMAGHTGIVASEGGHASFAPQTPLELELLRYLQREEQHISVEGVCSGALGIPRIYRFFCECYPDEACQALRHEIEASSHPTPLIVQAGVQQRCPAAGRSLELFVSILGSHAGNMALVLNAMGGVYFAGGIVPRILPFLQNDTLRDAFVRKGRMSKRLQRVPLYAVDEPRLAMYGARECARQHFGAG